MAQNIFFKGDAPVAIYDGTKQPIFIPYLSENNVFTLVTMIHKQTEDDDTNTNYKHVYIAGPDNKKLRTYIGLTFHPGL